MLKPASQPASLPAPAADAVLLPGAAAVVTDENDELVPLLPTGGAATTREALLLVGVDDDDVPPAVSCPSWNSTMQNEWPARSSTANAEALPCPGSSTVLKRLGQGAAYPHVEHNGQQAACIEAGRQEEWGGLLEPLLQARYRVAWPGGWQDWMGDRVGWQCWVQGLCWVRQLVGSVAVCMSVGCRVGCKRRSDGLCMPLCMPHSGADM